MGINLSYCFPSDKSHQADKVTRRKVDCAIRVWICMYVWSLLEGGGGGGEGVGGGRDERGEQPEKQL